jgi:hypothetical protein
MVAYVEVAQEDRIGDGVGKEWQLEEVVEEGDAEGVLSRGIYAADCIRRL